jgi:N6-adenosine-specific RNA methylase IME4
MNLPDGKWDVILADPPWFYYHQLDGLELVGDQCHFTQTHKTGAALEYDTMPDDDVFALHPERLLNKRGLLFMWATGPKMDVAFRALDAWSLHYRGMAFVWVKTRRSDGQPIGAKGPRPTTVKSLCEFVLVASNVKKGRPLPIADEKISQVVMAPTREHSRKPDEVHERIERIYPAATKLEMFARRDRSGWDVWGNEVNRIFASSEVH